MNILERLHKGVTKADNAYIAPNATVIGDITLGDDTSVWHGAILRGDVESIIIGDRSNIQDGAILHVTNDRWGCIIGKGVTIGHGVKLHGCTIHDNVLVGIGAIILDGAVIEEDCVIAAGSIVPPNKRIPKGSMVMGSPAKVVRELSEEDKTWIRNNAKHYVEYKKVYITEGL